MSIERSNGKARPTLPRSSDLARVEGVDVRKGGRDAQGRFLPRNGAAAGKGWRSLIRRSLGTEATTPAVERLMREARALHTAFMRELPFAGAQVTSLSAARARWTALSAYYANRAAELGLESDEARAALELAMRLDQRAERLAVTCLDVATALARAQRRGPAAVPWAVEAEATPTPAPSTDAPAGEALPEGEP